MYELALESYFNHFRAMKGTTGDAHMPMDQATSFVSLADRIPFLLVALGHHTRT
jgi:hypothetical protein